MRGLSIGEVARRAGLRPSALRYYEQTGLIAAQVRISGRRQYDTTVFNRLALIQYAKRVGFTIGEIKQLLAEAGGTAPASARWHALARRKQLELEARITEARRMKRLLRSALACRCQTFHECGRQLKDHEVQTAAASRRADPNRRELARSQSLR